MDRPTNIKNKNDDKDFWDTLQADILQAGVTLTNEEIECINEKNYMFSLFYRGTNHSELISFKKLYSLTDSGSLILLEFLPSEKIDFANVCNDDFALFSSIKKTLEHIPNAIGPMITTRIAVLISGEEQETKLVAQKLVDELEKEFNVPVCAGVGNYQSLPNIYTSFVEALSCMSRCQAGSALHVRELSEMAVDNKYEYRETERHMLESIRQRKSDSYDYFVLMMNYLKPLNDQSKRNRIFETLVLCAHATQIDRDELTDYYNYTTQLGVINELSGDELAEWALQRFIYITGFVKPQSTIDYSNKIVQATKEYLEAHYADEISLEDVAEQVNISPQYFSKLIKKNTGFNFIDWLSMLRVKKAKELLTNSNYTVKEVCFMVGYKDPNYFSRIFKKRIGITPSEFIKNRSNLSNTN